MNLDPLLVAYLTFAFILAATPGSTTAVVVRNTLAGGRGAGFSAAAGAALGNTSQATAAGLGLALLFARFPSAMVVLRVVGAAYLAWLGATSIWRVANGDDGSLRLLAITADAASIEERRTRLHENTKETTTRRSASRFRNLAWFRDASFRQGLTVNLLNPAISTFYLVVVPSFLPASAPWSSYAILASMHIAIAFTCHGVWALAFDRLRDLFRASAFPRRVLEVATGVALLALAVRVLFPP